MPLDLSRLSRRCAAALAALLLLIVLPVAGCGGDDGDTSGNETDAAFVADMIPHHQGAVEMAEIALQKSEREQIRRLSRNIIASQEAEIDQMERIRGDLPDLDRSMDHMGMEDSHMGMDHGSGGHMGMGGKMMGMDMDPDQLRSAAEFDRAFIDMMIPHHEGAVRMAMMLKADGENPQLQAMADEIIEAQNAEIRQMRQWREQWYPDSGQG